MRLPDAPALTVKLADADDTAKSEPTPDKLITWGLLSALSPILSVAAILPAPVGENFTDIVQLALIATVAQLFVWLN